MNLTQTSAHPFLLHAALLAALLIASVRGAAQGNGDEPRQRIIWDGVLHRVNAEVINLQEIRDQIILPKPTTENSMEGLVIVDVLVDTAGNYVRHEIVRDPHPQLTQLVEEQLLQLRFKPRTDDGIPTEDWVMVSFMLLQSETRLGTDGKETHHYHVGYHMESHLAREKECKATYHAGTLGINDLLEHMALSGLPDIGSERTEVEVLLQVSEKGMASVSSVKGMPSSEFEVALLAYISELKWTAAVECGKLVSSEVKLTLEFWK